MCEILRSTKVTNLTPLFRVDDDVLRFEVSVDDGDHGIIVEVVDSGGYLKSARLPWFKRNAHLPGPPENRVKVYFHVFVVVQVVIQTPAFGIFRDDVKVRAGFANSIKFDNIPMPYFRQNLSLKEEERIEEIEGASTSFCNMKTFFMATSLMTLLCCVHSPL